MTYQEQAGFTVVELLITLFVAAAFLIAGFQLYTVVLREGGDARAATTAGGVAYDYLRRYSGSVSNPCVANSSFYNGTVTATGLSNVTVNVAFSCPYTAQTNVSKIDVTVTYDTPQQTIKYSTYVTQ